MTLNDLIRRFPDDETARLWLESVRWPDGPECPWCGALDGNLADDAVAMTDGLPAYKHLGAKRTHLSVNHSRHQYARTDDATGLRVHVNTVECWNGLFHRAVVGVFHFVSTKHLGRYCAESAFRWNRKDEDALGRIAGLIRNGGGRLLPFRHLVGAAA